MTELQQRTPALTLVDLVMSANQLETYLLDQADNPALQTEIETMLEQVEHSLAVKADSYKFTMDRLTASAGVLRQRADENARAARALEGFVTRLKERIKAVMEASGRTEIRGEHYVFKLGNAAPKLLIHQNRITELPAKYQVITVDANKDLIREDHKRGIEIPGVEFQTVKALRVTVSKE